MIICQVVLIKILKGVQVVLKEPIGEDKGGVGGLTLLYPLP